MRILYVEDHLIFAENAKRQFLSQHLVTIVPSLTAAYEEIRQHSFDLLLVDYDLEDGKGDALIRTLNASQNRYIVIGVSSHAEGNAALTKAGAVAICSTMDFDRIQTVIDSVISSSSQTKNENELWE
jgi:DNA-binding NtrC family response regulator